MSVCWARFLDSFCLWERFWAATRQGRNGLVMFKKVSYHFLKPMQRLHSYKNNCCTRRGRKCVLEYAFVSATQLPMQNKHRPPKTGRDPPRHGCENHCTHFLFLANARLGPLLQPAAVFIVQERTGDTQGRHGGETEEKQKRRRRQTRETQGSPRSGQKCP